jgi:hypothetical protein
MRGMALAAWGLLFCRIHSRKYHFQQLNELTTQTVALMM